MDPTAESGAAGVPLHERKRAAVVATIPPPYSPLVHVVVPSVIGLSVLVTSIALLRGLRPVELLAVPATWMLAFGLEWRVHKYVLHRRTPGLGLLYERHELAHHVIYTADDMQLRSWREMFLILMPPYAVVLSLLSDIPIALLGLAISRNVGCLVVFAAMTFFLSYEWLHLAYHLPASSAIGRLAPIRRLRELHRRHHDPRLMKSWNFNVTIPVFDFLYGTLWSEERERARARSRS